MGVYIYGLFLEAASWDIKTGLLVDQKPGDMYFKMPVIWLETTKEDFGNKDDDEDSDDDEENKIYNFSCNVFKTLKRTGIIAKSGSSNTHVINIVSNMYMMHMMACFLSLLITIYDY